MTLRAFFLGLTLIVGGLAYAEDSISDVTLPLTKKSAAEQVQAQSGGKVLSVNPKQDGEQHLFRVKVLHDDGKIKIYQIDAKTGLEAP